MKKAGILMPVSALPGHYGIGDFGREAYRFVDMIKASGFKMWQILPLNPLGYGNSPYQAYSSKALDERYVSLEELKKEKLIDKLPEAVHCDKVDYALSQKIKREFLWESFRNFHRNAGYKKFTAQKWVKDYAVFITFKEINDLKCWVEWPEEFKDYPLKGNEELYHKYEDTIEFHCYIQYQLYKQFEKLKKYANKKGIEIMGDMPFYVGIDSDDVYYNRSYFMLYDDGRPEWIAGVPPDYFSATGQRWGNPLYDWEHLKKKDFDFWFDRIYYCSKIYDIVRIDHFRAFDTFWKIHSSEETAVNGEWIINCGERFFKEFFEKYPDIRIVAEDLGDLRYEVHQLRDQFNLMGMHVMEFNFFEPTSKHQIGYIGTHDNDTLLHWYRTLEKGEKLRVDRFMRKHYPGINRLDAFIQYCLDFECEMSVISVTDIVLANQRINLPGTIGSPNWEYRLENYRSLSARLKKVAEMIKAAGR